MDAQQNFTTQELMAVVISREINDGESVNVGTLSPLPAAGAWLALEHHAPNLNLSILGSPGAFNPERTEFFDLIQRGGCDLFFLSGAQIDKHANINLHVIGEYSSPRVRLPGGAGSGMIYYMAKRTILFSNRHTVKNLVDRVDFITTPGSSGPGIFRRGHPSLLITPLCAMRYNKDREELMLESIHPGTGLETVRQSTGWELDGNENVLTTPPSKAELSLLRTVVKEKMLQLYPEFAAKHIG